MLYIPYIIAIKVVCISTRLLAEQNEVEQLLRGVVLGGALTDQLTLSQPRGGGQIMPYKKYWHLQIFRPLMFIHIDKVLRLKTKRVFLYFQRVTTYIKYSLNQRVLNRWSKLSEQKLRFFSKVKI